MQNKTFFLKAALLIIYTSVIYSCNTQSASSIPSGAGKWEKFPAYQPGDTILYYTYKWNKGTIQEVGVPYDATNKNAVSKETKYLIHDANNWPEYMDYSLVVAPERKNWWTDFFTGEWNVGEAMAVNTRTDGTDVYDEYSYAGASDVLTIFPGGTYLWKTSDKQSLEGKWTALSDGPGILLLKAYKNMDWKFINQSNAITMHIRHLENARLFPSGNEISKSATRKMAE